MTSTFHKCEERKDKNVGQLDGYNVQLENEQGFVGINSSPTPTLNCSTEMMDVLFLAFNKGGLRAGINQLNAMVKFSHYLSDLHSNKTTPYVKFATVYDKYSALEPDVDVTSWQFESTNVHLNIYGLNDSEDLKQEYRELNETLQLKIIFIQRLFSVMGGSRDNASHVAVIFIDGFGLSQRENERLPKFVEHHDPRIKIFLLVINGENDREMMNSFQFAKMNHENIYASLLVMQICNQCLNGWFPFEHSGGSDILSCYLLSDNTNALDDILAFGNCFINGSSPVAIESSEEMNFLKSRLRNEFQLLGINYTTEVSLGLFRESEKEAFRWTLAYPIRKHPLVINNWFRGRSMVGYGGACVLWQFLWSSDGVIDTRNVSENEGHHTDGWMSVGCDVQPRFSLCEVVLPRSLEDMALIQIKPAATESFQESLTRGNFIQFEDNIISISTHIGSKMFHEFLDKAKVKLFPLFDCGEDAGEYRYISYLLVCDSLNDCSNNRDESRCVTELVGISLLRNNIDCRDYCQGMYCCDGLCLPLNYDGHVDCNVCLDISQNKNIEEDNVIDEYLRINKTSAFICHHGKCLYNAELTSSMNDCARAERLLSKTSRNANRAITCPNILGPSFWAPTCVYIKDQHGTVLDCRGLSHLVHCQHVVCPEGYVKCPNAYCIPQHYVLDGENDCPTGEDEQTNIIGPCTGNFACWDSRVCLHPDLVCDGHPDCPHRDDEIDCSVDCNEGFRCVSGTITISNYTLAVENMWNTTRTMTRYINFSGSVVKYPQSEYFTQLSNVMFIICSKCNITTTTLQTESNLRLVQHLELSYNLVEEFDGSQIDFHKFYNLRYVNLSHNKDLYIVDNLQFPFLEILDLSYTSLFNLRTSALKELPNLRHLDLSFTFISNFNGKNQFPVNFYPHTVNVRGLPIDIFNVDLFNGLYVSKNMYTDRFEFCCPQIRGPNIPSHVCHAPGDAISSCFDLIGVKVQRVLLWVFAVLAVLGNMTVIVYRIIWDTSVLKTGFGLFVTNLGISDFIMGVYLFIMAGADYYYRGVYVLYDKTWRESVLCKFAGFLVTLSCETSVFFVFLITLDRFLLMKFPFGQFKFSDLSKYVTLSCSWMLGVYLGITPIMFSFETYSSNAVCLGLPLTNKTLHGWWFSFSVFIILNMLLSLVIACGQRAIFRAMAENRCTAGSKSNSSSRRALDIIVAKQLSLVALSNFLCWFPIGVMGLMSVGGYAIWNEVYAWIMVIVLPINSAANPLLYTIPILMDKWKTFTFSDKRPQLTNNN